MTDGPARPAGAPGCELVAHRAGNDLAALRAAERCADLVEVDVHRHRGRLEARHAKVLWPTRRLWERWHLLPTGSTAVEVTDVLAAAAPGTHLLLDLKGANRAVAREAARLAAGRRPLTASTKPWWVLGPLRGTGIRTVRSAGNRLELALLLWLPIGRRVDGFGVHHRLLTPRIAARLRRRAGLLFAWGIEDRPTAERVAGWGVTGLILDDLGLLTELAAARSPHGDGGAAPAEAALGHGEAHERQQGAEGGVEDVVVAREHHGQDHQHG